MRARFALISITFAAVTALSLLAASDKPNSGRLRLAVGDEVYRACGLDELTSEQSDRLFEALRPGRGRSYLAESAMRFLESDGWRQIEVLGIRPSGSWAADEDFLAIADGYDFLVLDPFGSHDNLPLPGFYWAKNSASSWEIIEPDGDARLFHAVSD